MSRGLYIYRLTRDTLIKWIYDEGFMMGAALAYYSLFSIAPLLLIALTIAGIVFGTDAARGELEHQLTGYFGPGVAKSIQALLSAAQHGETGGALTIVIWGGALLFGASSVFAQLKLALNRIWKVETPRHSGIKALVINRLLALAMVAVVALLLLTSVLVSAALGRLSNYATHMLPVSPKVLQYADLGMTFFLLSILFAIIFRYLPDVRMGWKNVFLGAVFTSVLFAIGKILIGLYIAYGAVASGYGAASSVVVLLVWIYYSAMIFLFGAEFTHVYSRAHHLPAEPIPDAEPAGSTKP
jgi:membrane protein